MAYEYYILFKEGVFNHNGDVVTRITVEESESVHVSRDKEGIEIVYVERDPKLDYSSTRNTPLFYPMHNILTVGKKRV